MKGLLKAHSIGFNKTASIWEQRKPKFCVYNNIRAKRSNEIAAFWVFINVDSARKEKFRQLK